MLKNYNPFKKTRMKEYILIVNISEWKSEWMNKWVGKKKKLFPTEDYRSIKQSAMHDSRLVAG